MKCAGCVQVVEKQLNQQTGVCSATVNLVTQKATVEYEANTVAPAELADLLTQKGFPSQVHCEDLGSADAQMTTSNSGHPTSETSPGLVKDQRQKLVTRLRQVGLAALLVVLSAVGHFGQLQGLALPGLSSIWFHWGLATLALAIPGRDILIDGWLAQRRLTPNMNTLVSLGAITAYTASVVALLWPQLNWECFFDAPVMIVGLILLGRTLEEQARGQATEALESLLSLQPTTARLILQPDTHPEKSAEVPIHQVGVGARLQVLPGDKFPVDGCIMAGQTLVNESMLTGEAFPVSKIEGDRVTAGTLNQSAAITIEATQTGSETTLARIIQLVETAQARKAPIQRVADVVAGYFTYGVMAIATLTFLFWAGVGTKLWPQVLGQHASQTHTMEMLSYGHLTLSVGAVPHAAALLLSLKLAIAVLVIACPCALGLATPTAILVGTSLGAERGLLIRGGDVLEQIHHLDTVVFDKTGTLTTGHPIVTDYWLADTASEVSIHTPEQLLQIAASAESGTRHPFAAAILNQAQTLNLPLLSAQSFETIPGCGVSAQVAGQSVLLGTRNWLAQQNIVITPEAEQQTDPLTAKGKSVIYVAIAGCFAGVIAVMDPLKPDANRTLEQLKQLGLKIKMLTGDQLTTAKAIAASLPFLPEDIQADLSPADKAAQIAQWQAQGHRVAMVGDGINDAPALAEAEVGIALRSGTDVAAETAQVILMRSEVSGGPGQLADVVSAIRLSRATFRKIQQNLFWAFAYNIMGIPVAAGVLLPTFGILLNPAAAAAIMAFSSVSVVSNSLLLRRCAE